MGIMDFLKKYVDVIHPKRFGPAIANEAKKDDANLTFLHVLFISLFGILTFVAYLFMYIKTMAEFNSSLGLAITSDLLAVEEQLFQSIMPLTLILKFIYSIVAFYAVNTILFFICRALGGNGKLGNQLYVTSVVTMSISVLQTLFIVPLLPLLPLSAGFLIICVMGLLTVMRTMLIVYSIFLSYIAVRAVHTNLSQWRVIAAIILLVLVIIVIEFALNIFFNMFTKVF